MNSGSLASFPRGRGRPSRPRRPPSRLPLTSSTGDAVDAKVETTTTEMETAYQGVTTTEVRTTATETERT